MSRKRSGLPIDGWLALDKPLGMTSAQAVAGGAACHRAPPRSGMAARSTRWPPGCCRSPWARPPRPCRTSWTAPRSTACTVRWGEARDTDDAEGEVTATCDGPADARRDRGGPAGLRRRHQAGAAGLFGDQGGGRARLRPGPGRRAGRCWNRAACASTASSWSASPMPTMPISRRWPARAPISARWPATWPGLGHASATSRALRRLAGRPVPRGRRDFPGNCARGRARSRRFGAICFRSRPRWTTSRRWP